MDFTLKMFKSVVTYDCLFAQPSKGSAINHMGGGAW